MQLELLMLDRVMERILYLGGIPNMQHFNPVRVLDELGKAFED
ncbi:MAG: hypothetical protein QGG78_04350 [Acidimicrobiales bacterium]|jgi:bacterioferritin (cytochrome b1)|nr:hypothetical protein [Acidimicrobiales bacterium]